MAQVGFIGVGKMGGPMANNLMKAGHEVQVFDLCEAALDAAVSGGADGKGSAAEAAAGVDVVVTMLPEGRHVRSVYIVGGILDSAQPNTLFVDSSTIDVTTAREIHQAADAAGMEMIDAPVSGGVVGAEAATLTFMCGGTDDAFERAHPYLERMGKNIVHAGPAGNGQAAKICNNMVLGISMIAISEAFVLAEKLGLDDQTLFEIASTASGQCWSLTNYCPVPGPVPASPANRDYQAGFTAANMLKDLRISQEAASGFGASTRLGEAATMLYEAYAETQKQGHMDFSGIIKFIRETSSR